MQFRETAMGYNDKSREDDVKKPKEVVDTKLIAKTMEQAGFK